MTETRRPPACHYDRNLKTRVTRGHRDDCPRDTDCPGKNGCAPCTAPHCTVCGREHTTNSEPHTCPDCQGHVRDDLADLQACYTALAIEAQQAGGDGHLVAAARIPGGNAAVLIGPTVRLDLMRVAKGYRPEHMAEVHRPSDPIPPLAVLAQWEEIYRSWLGHGPGARASVAGAIRYLTDQLPYIANHVDDTAPDWLAFTRQVRNARAQLERTLHDEREPEVGVECFECGDRLVRRFRDPKRCRHSTPARVKVARQMRGRAAALTRLAWLDEEIRDDQGRLRPRGRATVAEERAALLPTPVEMAAARLPCPKCSQGGLDNPDAGQSWECPGCRKEYTPGEYHTAVRRDLLSNEDGWTTIIAAAQAAKTLTGGDFSEVTIRSWVGRGWVRSRRETQKSGIEGRRLVHWPDVKREALRFAVGLQHCKHRTPARVWLATLATYPELEVSDDEVEAGWEECAACAAVVDQGGRRARGAGVA